MAMAKLLELNPSFTVDTILSLGDELNVTAIEPYVEVEVHYETRKKKQLNMQALTEEDSSLYKGEKKVTQKGSDGEKKVTELIRKRNGQNVGSSISDEKIIAEAEEQSDSCRNESDTFKRNRYIHLASIWRICF